MKERHFIQVLLYILCFSFVLQGCGAKEKHFTPTTFPTTASSEASPKTTKTPEPDTEAFADAYKNYTANAPIAAVYDTKSNEYFYTKQDGSTRIYPASTTKLLTALVALSYLSPQEFITAGDELNFVAEDASIAEIEKGDTLSVDNLISGLLLPSGNDVAYVLACAAGRRIGHNELLAPSQAVQYFVNEMNVKASQLGCFGSHFVSPDGYHTPEHYTTIDDLIIIAMRALENSIIAKHVCTANETALISPDRTLFWKNTNLLLHSDSPYYTEDAVGLKTGYTKEAGYVLLSAFRNRLLSSYIIILVAKCPTPESRFEETRGLYKVIQDVDLS